jgi:hypothetical protein
VKASLDEICEEMLGFSDKLKVYTQRAIILVEDRRDLRCEICMRRSVIQVLLDT